MSSVLLSVPAVDPMPPRDVSIVITCFNQARYLAEAIESVLNQTHRNLEIVVVDDGSKDEPQAIARRYPEVVFMEQPNQGACVARNRGLESSSGRMLVFMDGDDRLLPHAIETGLANFAEHPECAFVYGWFRLIEADGSKHPFAERPIEQNHYRALLARNFLVLHGGMFRRDALERLGAFDPVDWECADLDLYLRMTRSLPALCHGQLIAERRIHDAQASQNWLPMLGSSLRVLRRQWNFVKGDPVLREAYFTGRKRYQWWFGEHLVTETHFLLRERQWRAALPRVLNLGRYYFEGFMALIKGLRQSNALVFPVISPHSPPARPMQGAESAEQQLQVIELIPNHTIVGQRFNPRSDGNSVLGVRCRNASIRTTIIFDGRPLTTFVVDPNYVWGLVPFDRISQQGYPSVYLLK